MNKFNISFPRGKSRHHSYMLFHSYGIKIENVKWSSLHSHPNCIAIWGRLFDQLLDDCQQDIY